ncbi:MAG TPA: ACP S-malonyltransferase [Methylocella sp.]|nr:ACP S-malonyltransferase [Methylocella sp.]
MSKALVFPGQGSQAPGMGKALADGFSYARQVFAEVDDALGEKLSRLIFEGPLDELTLTANAQPALFAASLAVIRVLEKEAGLELSRDIRFVAGHSLGEYSALAAAGAFSVAEGAKLLRVRGRAMQEAVPVGSGAMAALLGLDCAAAAAISAEAASPGKGEVCEVANDNGGGQVVVSGSSAAVARATEIAKARGARRSVLLPVSAPFHCTLMQPAADAMAAALAAVAIASPCVPVVSNVLAAPVTDPEEIRKLLVAQVTRLVRWRESAAYMASQGVSCFVECGSGKVLSGLIKRIVPEARSVSIGSPENLALYKETVESS